MSTSLSVPNAPAGESDPPRAAGEDSSGSWLAALEDPPRRGRARLWGAAVIAVAILALAGVTGFLVWRADEPAVSTVLTATGASGAEPAFKVRLEPRRRRALLIPVAAASAPKPGKAQAVEHAKRARELWLMRAYGPPTPLGLVDPDRATTLAFDPTLLSADNPATHLFVSLEAPGGSPTGYPKGPLAAEAFIGPR